MTTTLDIRDYLLENSPWVDPDRTVDTVKFGDPSRDIAKAGVCWYPSIETIQMAESQDCELLITHEPLFWNHEDPEGGWRDKEPGRARVQVLERAGMTVLRAHDSWDQWPGLGIRDSWAQWLGLDNPVYKSNDTNYHAVYEIAPCSLKDYAGQVATLVKRLGEDSVRVMGEPDKEIKKVAIGVGCIGPDSQTVDAGADALIVCYDGASYWAVRERLYEMGAALIVVEHGTSELPGMKNLCEHLTREFEDVRFQFFGSHVMPWTVFTGGTGFF